MKKKEEKDYVLDGAKKVLEVLDGSLTKDVDDEIENEKDSEKNEDIEFEIPLNEEQLKADLEAIEKEKKEFEDKGEVTDDEIDYNMETKEVEEESEEEDQVPRKHGKSAIEELDEEKEVEALRKLEAVLFVSGRFLSLQELISYTDTNPIILRELLEKLSDKYENDEASALQIVNKNNLYKMDVKIEYNEVINRLATGRSEFTKAEKETLAIIAYKQPIKQSVVIKIRGNKAYDHIKKYVDLGLIKKKKVGHTNDLTLSDEFYDYFGMATGEDNDVVSEIPRVETGDADDDDEE
ncbi:SMC-Scp complex subunit ScpB [Candidatus Pacearchaeota archaeon CG10_big_fil_rev_8_21_14_0_10_32_14]|nr:MAG: SMC-Scp complex subunit ScpB [Candidatus Pacearchaeota archaeon CG10_big_fil_rev_8_21_14_0_10_32_14]